MCTITKVLQESLNSFVVNCGPLSDKIESGIPKPSKSSCKNLIVRLRVGFYISSLLAISRNCQPQLNNIVPLLDLENIYTDLTKVCG